MESQPQMLATLQKKEAQEKVLTEKWTEKWKETQKILQEQKALGLRKFGTGVVLDSDMPHLIGIDDDLLSTGVTLYHLKVCNNTQIKSLKNDWGVLLIVMMILIENIHNVGFTGELKTFFRESLEKCCKVKKMSKGSSKNLFA